MTSNHGGVAATDDQRITLSVVVPTRNRRDALARLLASIAAQEQKDLEVLIIDDASENPVDLVEVVAGIPSPQLFPIRLKRYDSPIGACAARNAGIAQATGRYVLFLDDDVEFAEKDLCSRLISFADENPTIGIVALAELVPSGEWGFNFGPPGPPTEVARFNGCGALFRKACLDEVGGFLEPLNYYYEEFEISMRVINAGWHIIFHSRMLVVHHRDPRGRNPRAISRLVSRNAFFTAIARFPIWMLPPALLLQAARFLRISCKRQDYWGLFFVITQVFAKLPTLLRERKPVSARALRRYKSLAVAPEPWTPAHPAIEGRVH